MVRGPWVGSTAMEHEVFVPVPADRLRQVLDDPEKVAGAVPGLQRDADEAAAPLSGRLKVRVGGHTITYRGAARVAARGDDGYVVEGEGTEVRGSGSVKISLTVRVVPADGGARVLFGGTASADGRVAESSPQAVEGAVRRLLERFAAALAPPEEAASAASPAAEPRSRWLLRCPSSRPRCRRRRSRRWTRTMTTTSSRRLRRPRMLGGR